MKKETEKLEKRPANAKEWDKITAMYVRGETLDYIMKSFPEVRLTKNSIMAKMQRSGMISKKKAIEAKVQDNLTAVVEEERLKTNNMCISLFNSGAEVIRDLINEYKDEMLEGGVPKSKAKATAYNMDLLMSGVTKIQKGLRVAYGMDDNNKLYEKEPEVLVIEGVDSTKI